MKYQKHGYFVYSTLYSTDCNALRHIFPLGTSLFLRIQYTSSQTGLSLFVGDIMYVWHHFHNTIAKHYIGWPLPSPDQIP